MSILLNQIKSKLAIINNFYKVTKINLYPKNKKYFIGYEKDDKVIYMTELKTLNEINDFLQFALNIQRVK